MRLQKADWSNFDESNDYSVGPGAAFPGVAWAKVTVYRGATLVWGTPP